MLAGEPQLFLGNNLSLDLSGDKNGKFLVVGNNCTLRIRKNVSWIKIVGDNCTVRVASAGARVDYVGNNGAVYLEGEDITVDFVGSNGVVWRNGEKVLQRLGDAGSDVSLINVKNVTFNARSVKVPHLQVQESYDYQENNQNHTNLPAAITVEVLPAIKQESVIISTEAAVRSMLVESLPSDNPEDESATGVHFLTDDDTTPGDGVYEKKKHELLEYLTRHDGSVVCKLCGEVLASRTHWYRHKYKLHVNNLVNPAPLFKCARCNVFFKSRKGYVGHIAARHSSETPPEQVEETVVTKEEEAEPKKKREGRPADWEEQRVKEEKLVADIIDRVRRECEAQGAAVSRRGYSRRSTVMNTCN